MSDKYEKIDLDVSLNEFVEDSQGKAPNDDSELTFQNIDHSIQELSKKNNINENSNLQVNFKDGFSVRMEEVDDQTLLTVSGKQINDITLQKNNSGELESIEIESDNSDNLIFRIPESNITIDPFLDGRISSFKNPDQKKFVILKIGTSSITTERGKFNYALVQDLVEVILRLKEQEYSTLIVSSGAKGLGRNLLKDEAKDISSQSLTAIGQSHLISIYDNIFKNYNIVTSQILLAYNDLEYKENIRNTIFDLAKHDIIPIINSNDPVICSDNIDIDNDKLAAAIGKILNASHLFIISDSGGLYDSDPNKNPEAKLMEKVNEITPAINALANSESGSGLGTGGIKSKIIAASSCLKRNSTMGLLSKDAIQSIPDLVKNPDSKFNGTVFLV